MNSFVGRIICITKLLVIIKASDGVYGFYITAAE